MTTTTTPAARVSGTISKKLRIAGWHDAADYVAGELMQSRILAAIQPGHETKLVAQDTICDDCSKLVRHNTAHWMDDGASYCPSCRPLPATPSSAGTVSVEAAARVLLDVRNRDGMTVLPEYVREMLRAIAGDKP